MWRQEGSLRCKVDCSSPDRTIQRQISQGPVLRELNLHTLYETEEAIRILTDRHKLSSSNLGEACSRITFQEITLRVQKIEMDMGLFLLEVSFPEALHKGCLARQVSLGQPRQAKHIFQTVQP